MEKKCECKKEVPVKKINDESERERTFNNQSMQYTITFMVITFSWMIASILGTVSLLGVIIWLLSKIVGM